MDFFKADHFAYQHIVDAIDLHQTVIGYIKKHLCFIVYTMHTFDVYIFLVTDTLILLKNATIQLGSSYSL